MSNASNLKGVTVFAGKRAWVVIAVSCLSIPSSWAKTDINAKIQQLRENRDVSAHNLRVVEDGQKKIVQQLSEVERALKQIQSQRAAIAKQSDLAGQTKQKAGATQRQLQAWMSEEERALTVERKQAAELREALARLESNEKIREANLASYREKLSQIGTELGDWSGRNQEVLALDSALGEKEAQAKADLIRLSEKRTELEREISKWRQESRSADREHENFSKLGSN